MNSSFSSISSIAKRYEWVLKETFENEDDLDDFIYFKIPLSKSTSFRSNEIYCKFKNEHKMDVQRRDCMEFENCPVKYKILKCKVCVKYEFMQSSQHNHNVEDTFDNLNGIHKRVKEIILNLMDHGKTTPKQIHLYLTLNQDDFKGLGVPQLKQVQGFVIRNKPTFKTRNLIKCVSDFVLHNQLTVENINDETKPFVFGTKFDGDKPIIGSGSNDNHLHILMTSLMLIRTLDTTNQSHISIFHIDGTYKITRNKFPLVIFGRTDINRHFHPIIFFLTSHEDTSDFTYFYEELKNLIKRLSVDFNITIPFTFTFLMQDACLASYYAVKSVFPSVYVLVCWYHLKTRIEIHVKDLNNKDLQADILKDVNLLHYSWSYTRYCEYYNFMMAKWDKWDQDGVVGIKKFKDYFNAQWINNCFNLWQIFNTPAGLSPTNSPQESFNREVKSTFTIYNKLSVHECLVALMSTIILYYSVNKKKFDLIPTTSDIIIKKSENLKADMFNVSNIKHIIIYTNRNKNFSFAINLQDKICPCSYFLDRKICHHLIAAAKFYGVNLIETENQAEFFTEKKKKGRPKKTLRGA